jgi:hypothetical protein
MGVSTDRMAGGSQIWRRRRGLALALGAVVVAGVLGGGWWWNTDDARAVNGDAKVMGPRKSGPRGDGRSGARELRGGARGEEEAAASVASDEEMNLRLAELQEQWRDFDVAAREMVPVIDWPAGEALAKESARLLLCSRQMLALMRTLREGEVECRHLLNMEVLRLLRQRENGRAMRSLLTGLPDEDKTSEIVRGVWLIAAAEICPADELEAFRASIGSTSWAQELTFKMHQREAARNPEGALKGMLGQLEKGIDSEDRDDALVRPMMSVPEDADFAKLDAVLSGSGGKFREDGTLRRLWDREGYERSVSNGRVALMQRWVDVDAETARGYAVGNLATLDPAMMEPLSYEMAARDPDAGYAWVRNLPDGPHFDVAARELIGWLDPARRAELLERMGGEGGMTNEGDLDRHK